MKLFFTPSMLFELAYFFIDQGCDGAVACFPAVFGQVGEGHDELFAFTFCVEFIEAFEFVVLQLLYPG